MASWIFIGSAIATAAAGLMHAAHTLYRDMTRKPEGSGHGHRQAESVPQAASPASDQTLPPPESSQERSWVQKSHARQARPAHREGHSVGGRH